MIHSFQIDGAPRLHEEQEPFVVGAEIAEAGNKPGFTCDGGTRGSTSAVSTGPGGHSDRSCDPQRKIPTVLEASRSTNGRADGVAAASAGKTASGSTSPMSQLTRTRARRPFEIAPSPTGRTIQDARKCVRASKLWADCSSVHVRCICGRCYRRAPSRCGMRTLVSIDSRTLREN
jgi:hypothetical protein